MWQTIRTELHPLGLEVVTVALDTGGADVAGRFIDDAAAEHPSLIDQAHVLDELFGVVNVPSGIWIDEQGMIVRPPEPAVPGRSMFGEILAATPDLAPDADPYVLRAMAVVRGIRRPTHEYLDALRDWAHKGAGSRFALAPDEVIARSGPRPVEAARAAAHFELGQFLHREGRAEAAVPHFREAHRLEPDNWTYKRQAWSFIDRAQGPSDVYDGDWVGDVERLGPENYYPPLHL